MAQGLKSSKTTLHCSFCGQSQHDVKTLIAGPTVFICGGCTDLCNVIISENQKIETTEGFSNVFPELSKYLESLNIVKDLFEVLDTRPIFPFEDLLQQDDRCFYLGPFCDPFNIVYEDQIRSVVCGCGFLISRADEIYGTRPIMQDIWDSIFTSKFIIADVTGKNPNVMYEIGMAHALGKPVIMLTQNIDDVPFDLRHYRCVLYEYTPRGCEKLSEMLRNTIKSLGQVDYSLAIRGRVVSRNT